MKPDLVDRLDRAVDPRHFWSNVPSEDLALAADELRRLRAELARAKVKLAVLEETQAELAKERQRAFDAEEKLRGERERVVAWLREQGRYEEDLPDAMSAYLDAALGVERGDHESKEADNA